LKLGPAFSVPRQAGQPVKFTPLVRSLKIQSYRLHLVWFLALTELAPGFSTSLPCQSIPTSAPSKIHCLRPLRGLRLCKDTLLQ